MIPVRLTKQAQTDITEAAEWYERKERGLGDRFLDRVYEAVEKIGANPQGYAVVFEKLRRTNLQQFPYALFFQIRSDNSLVIACLHHRRNPQLAKERALGIVPMRRRPEPET